MPLTEQEYQVNVKEHLEGIARLLTDAGHPLSLDRHRHCYVTGQSPEGLARVLHQPRRERLIARALPSSGKR